MANDIKPAVLKQRLDAHEPIVLLDIRDGWEIALAHIDNATHIPMEELEHRTEELDPKDEIVVICHHGVRSAAVADYLGQLGFSKVWNLSGGIDQWARSVDRGMQRY
jgi:rhodanese-related sulfurtransferase